MKNPQLTLVGAGPGDPELITLKGVKALEGADVVLYDALVNVELLKLAPVKARKVFVGKRKGACLYTQDQINELIVEYAHKYGHVVRLKGGDPFVFGRGHEEMEYAQQHNIPIEVVPGISSSLSVPALQHIPVTKRNFSESVWIITGTTKKHNLSSDIEQAVKTNATVVVLMGMGNLRDIVAVYQKEGKGELPVGIIQGGSTEREKTGLGTIDTIEEVVRKKELSSPAIIVIGEVVRVHPHYLNELTEQIKLEIEK